MTLTVENGSGLAGADSYVSQADATTYHDGRGNTAWTDLSSDEMDAALRRATDYLGETYRPRWKGDRTSTTQALDWPRYNVERADIACALYASNAVPAEVVRACCEMALRAAKGPLTPDQGQAIKSVAAGSVNVTYADYSAATKSYPAIDGLLRPLLSGSAGGVAISKV